MKSGNLNFLETSEPLQACNGTALPFTVNILSNMSPIFPSGHTAICPIGHKPINGSTILTECDIHLWVVAFLCLVAKVEEVSFRSPPRVQVPNSDQRRHSVSVTQGFHC